MPVKENPDRDKVLAVASSGGHWVQLRRVTQAFADSEVVYVTVIDSYRSQVPENRFYSVHDATRWNKLGLLILACNLIWSNTRPTTSSPGSGSLRRLRRPSSCIPAPSSAAWK